jgi:hypothetical protein
MKTPIYNWAGNYWGFIYNERLFDKEANYKGWIDDNNQVWDKNGEYLGEIVQENYILRNTNKMEPMSRMAKMEPMEPMAPIPKMDRIGKNEIVGWIDALEKLK